MEAFALALVLASAFVHASWNFLLKKSGGGPGIVTAASAASLVVWLPVTVGVIAWQGYAFQPMHLVMMLGSGIMHMAYFLLLDRAYRSGGDLSVVYPLARATGPLLTIVAAVLVLGEKPGPTGVAGAILIVASAIVLTGNPFSWHRGPSRQAVGFALLTGCTIASYTVWDKVGVSHWTISPIVYDYGSFFFRAVVLVPWTHAHAPGDIARAWRERRKTVLAIAAMSPLAYILVLTAMAFTPVSLVAPAREVSILFAALMGAHLLREGDIARRVVAAIGMALGVAGLALG